MSIHGRDPSFPGHAPGKDTLRAANAATERGSTGENARANAVSGRALSPVLICLFVKIRDPSFPGHAPGQVTVRAANAATERGLTGEKTPERATRSEGVVVPVISYIEAPKT